MPKVVGLQDKHFDLREFSSSFAKTVPEQSKVCHIAGLGSRMFFVPLEPEQMGEKLDAGAAPRNFKSRSRKKIVHLLLFLR